MPGLVSDGEKPPVQSLGWAGEQEGNNITPHYPFESLCPCKRFGIAGSVYRLCGLECIQFARSILDFPFLTVRFLRSNL